MSSLSNTFVALSERVFKEGLEDDVVDRTILIWYMRDLYNAKDRKTFRINVEYDHVYKLVWSPDSKAILGFKATDNSIEVYRLERKDGSFTSYGRSITFPRAHENDDVISLDIACNGRFIMSASNKTELIIWDIRGNVLEQLNTFTMSNYCAKISPCGRFVEVSGYAPDVKFWEVKFGKTGNYEKTVKAFDLIGHNAGVWDFAFDQDASHCVTVCKDGYWRLFDINIDYARGESPRCLLTGEYESKAVSPLIALSNSAHVIVIGCGNNIQFFSGLNGNLDNTIENVFYDHIMSIAFDSLGLQLYVAGDRQVRVFHNITGYKVGIEVAKEKLKDKKTTAATRERLESQVVEYENFIAENAE
ncbi:unnamed protein product [Chironomus riparius]|uniref:Uncharacterized protein n=1 Tax=Chironomus riparius TaxID=315576 RepID=A0A9N9WP04_9DIPT|nr:unnamed protein product [Chironomus riparius]